VQIDIAPRMLGLRYPMEVNLHGDSKLTLQALMPLLDRKGSRAWRKKIAEDISEWWEVLEARAMHEADPINPQRLFWELSSRLPDRCILTCDSGSAANWYARDVKIRSGMRASLSGGLATMCPAVPYATAAKFAHPDRVAIAMVGDGAMQMLGNDGLVTISKYWQEWSDPRLVVLVLKNLDLNQVTWEQRVMNGDPRFQASQDLPAMNYAEFARMLGLDGVETHNGEPRSAVRLPQGCSAILAVQCLDRALAKTHFSAPSPWVRAKGGNRSCDNPSERSLVLLFN
jgi:pyruvate dehydrogenase (quinone)